MIWFIRRIAKEFAIKLQMREMTLYGQNEFKHIIKYAL